MLLYFLNNLNFIVIMLQIFLIYNILQIIKQTNFYYLFSYFILIIIYFGIFLIIYDLDLNSVILWIVYGGLGIIFFTYSLMWFEIFKNFYKLIKLKNNYFLYFIMFMLFVYFVINLKIYNITYFLTNCFYINYYNISSKNNMQELELMG
jgi:hypothetical protein